jgi:hypothetical protein
MEQLTRRQQLLQAQQDLIDSVPERVDVGLFPYDEIRLSTVRPGFPHPNHTYISVKLAYQMLLGDTMPTLFDVIVRKGRRQYIRVSKNMVGKAEMLKVVHSSLYVIGAR